MTKSTITRERLEQLADNNTICKVSWDERIELAQIALAAMDSSESVEMPLDYLQGHKDGLEWAAQLAEANHPEAGDWLYDDPIELAKAIRKGPDMPPVQPVADSEPVAWTWHYREQWHVTNDERRAEFVAKDGDVAVLPLYRHAQPATISEPVFFIEVEGDDWINAGRIEGKNRPDLGLLPDGINYLYAAPQPLTDAEREELQELRKADSESVAEVLSNRPGNDTSTIDRALPVGTQLYRQAQQPVVPEEWTIADAVKFCKKTGRQDAGSAMAAWNACRAAMLQELKKSAGTEATCRSNENVQAVEVQSLTSINPAPDLVSLRKKAESIIGNYPGIPDGSEHCPCCGKKLRRTCSVEGCGGKHVAHGLCQKHYDMQRWEDPEQVERFREAGRRYREKKKSTVATPQEPKP